MNKIIFITSINWNKNNGGKVCSVRNYESLVDIHGKENVILIHLDESIERKSGLYPFIKDRILGILHCRTKHLHYHSIKRVLNAIESYECQKIFLDVSLLGTLARIIKKKNPDISLTGFFHNCEYDFYRKISSDKKLHLLYWTFLAFKNEKRLCKYANNIITLTQRDSDRINKLYGREADYIIPISMKRDESINENMITRASENNRNKALFVGSYFFGNIFGLSWFIENVLPEVNIHLTVVGVGMEKLKEKYNSTKLTIFGRVENLNSFYEEADFMIMPIFDGAGMKVKTAEALMHGKYIIGTTESLIGYNITKKEACICKTSQDFITGIRDIIKNGVDKTNKSSIQIFNKYYSHEATLDLFKKIF